MRALDFPERALPRAPLILDLGVHTPTVADLGADSEDASRPAAGTVRARIRCQLTDQQNRVVGSRVPGQESGDKSTRMPDLITAPRKRKSARA